MPGWRRCKRSPGAHERQLRRRRAVIRILLVLLLLAGTAGAVVAYGDPEQIARAGQSVTEMLRQRIEAATPAVAPAGRVGRGPGGGFARGAKINGGTAPMGVDPRATSG